MTPTEMHDECDNYYNANYKARAREARKERYLNNKCNACNSCSVAKTLELKSLN